MDSSGFLTLIAVILTALSLLSRGRKVAYLHKFGWPHFIFFIISFVIIISCLFYDFFKEIGWLLPCKFVPGFDQDKLLLLISIVIIFVSLITIKFGQTMNHRVNSLFNCVSELLVHGLFSDLSYVLECNADFFESEEIRKRKSTELVIKKLILSNRFVSYLEEYNYPLLNRVLRFYPDSDISVIKFNEFISRQLSDRKTPLMWEVSFLFQGYSPRVPSDDTPLLKLLYCDRNLNFKYSLYEQLGLGFDALMKDTNVVNSLNESPCNVQRDLITTDSLPVLYIFLYFNLLKYDLRKCRIIRRDQGTIRTPWIFFHKYLRNILEYRKMEENSDNEFKTRFDFFLYESFRYYSDLFDVDNLFQIDGCELIDFIESVSCSFYFFFNNDMFDKELHDHILCFAVRIFSKIKSENQDLAREFAILCTHEYKGAIRQVNLETKNFEVLKMTDAREFISISNE